MRMPPLLRRSGRSPGKMRISIITPTFNRADLLPETIESILGQNYPNLEYIVLDDGSTDDTPSVLERYADRIRVFRHENMGETATVNKGFSLVSGDIVCVVCSDDPLMPGAIRHVVEAFQKNPSAVAVYPDWVDIGPQGEFLRAIRLPEYDIQVMLITMSWGLGPGAFFRRSLIERLGGRNPERVYCGDMEFWARAAMLGPLVHVPKVLATHRTHAGSASIGCLSGAFAREWVDTWRSLFNRPELPLEIAVRGPEILGKIYLKEARWYSGKDRLSAAALYFSGYARLSWISILSWRARLRVSILRWGTRLLAPILRWGTRLSFRLLIGFARWKHQLSPGVLMGIPNTCLRFAICTRFTPPLWSGQAVVIGRLIKGLSPESYCMVSLPLYPEKQDDVNYTPALQGKRYLLPLEPPLPGIQLFSILGKGLMRRIGLSYQAWQRGVNIAKALREDSTDTIVGCSGDLLDLPAAWVASRLLGRRFVVYFFDDYTEQWWADPPLRAFANVIERHLLTQAAQVLVTNEYMQAEIARRYGKPSQIIRNPASLGPLPQIIDRYPAEQGEVKLVFTGAVYHLNYDILRAIVAALAGMPKDIFYRLHIYTAQSREQLEAEGLTGSHVIIHGHVTPDEAAEIQRNADILLIPFSFLEDARGIVRTAGTAKLGDYLAAGRPILALCPEDSFLTWFLREQACGIAFSSGEPAEIAKAISMIVEQPALRRRMQRNARHLALTEFDPSTAQSRLVKALGLITLPAYLRTPAPQKHAGQLKVVQVSAMDIVGIQVNGFLMHKWMQEQGHDSRMLVYSRMSGDPQVREIGSPLKRTLNPLFVKAEAKFDSVAMLPILSHRLDNDPWVRDADIVNLQLIHAAPFFSLLDLPRLTRKRRVVLSVHDMFLFSGHCIYSMDCDRWKIGCGQCPDLGLPFQMSKDTTARNWKLKRWAFDRSELDIVVGSPWQEERVSQSPILNRFRRHMIPYGVDTRVFKPTDKKEARRRLGLPEDAHVIAFRSTPGYRNFKGTSYIHEALSLFQPRRPTVLVTFDTIGGLDDLREKYQFHELGWVIDGEKIAPGLQAADIFVMPSIAEAFGLMAIESMACGTPPIVFDGTALPDTIGGSDCGVIVPQGDSNALAQAIGDCLDNPGLLDRYRQNGLRHVAAKHSFEDYARRYLELYQELAKSKLH